MNKKSRAILFLACVSLFFLTSAAAVFYSLGYRLDFENKKITKTGAFYFKVWPKSAQIYLNGQLKKKTDFLFGAALIDNLLPKAYTVQIKKEGYLPWEKTLEIKEGPVTEAKNIVLVPETPGFEVLAGEVDDFFFAPDNKKVVLEETAEKELPRPSEGGVSPSGQVLSAAKAAENGWQLALYDLRNGEKGYLIGKKDFEKKDKDIRLQSIKFSADSRKALLETKGEENQCFILDLEKSSDKLISLGFLGEGARDIDFDPQDPQKIFFTKIAEEEELPHPSEGGVSPSGQVLSAARAAENKKSTKPVSTPLSSSENAFNLFQADWTAKEISQPLLVNFIAYLADKEHIFWLSREGFFFRSGLDGKNQEKLSQVQFPIKEGANYRLLGKFPEILLQENTNLYLFNQELKSFKQLSAPGTHFSFSPDSKKLVYWNNYEIWILFLEEKLDQPQKKQGEEIFLTRFSEKIGDCFWWTAHYLIFDAGDKIKIAEIDDRDKINIIDLSTAKATTDLKDPKMFWNLLDKKLYILSENKLLISDKLIP